MKTIKKNFFASLRWNLISSFIFEGAKLIHQIALLSILGVSRYGQIGISFSVIYFSLNLADLESGSSLFPFLPTLTISKKLFITVFLRYLLINILLLGCGALCAYSWCIFYAPSIILIAHIIAWTILTEGIRLFLRSFLQSRFFHKQVIIIDFAATFAYFILIWLPYILIQTPLTLQRLIQIYSICSFLAILAMSYCTLHYIKQLPYKTHDICIKNLYIRMAKIRFLNYGMHVSKYFFTGNFLTPLFASFFGLQFAGLIKFSSYLADAIKAFLKVSIGFSGSALLSHLKSHSLHVKRAAFSALYKTLSALLLPIIIFVVCAYQRLLVVWQTYQIKHLSMHTATPEMIVFALLLLIISLFEQLFLMYEEFYLIEEELLPVFLLKLLEGSLLYILLFSSPTLSAQLVLVGVSCVRFISFIILALHARSVFGITPSFTLQLRFILLAIFMGCIIRILI